MWKIYSFVAILLLFVSFGAGKICKIGDQEYSVSDRTECYKMEGENSSPYFFPGFPFPPGVNFPQDFFPSIPGMRPTSRPRPRPRPDNRERCPNEGVKLISHPRECEKYIVCIDGDEITTLTCPGGLHFSRETRNCMDPRLAGCEEFEFSCPDTNEVGFLPDVNDCSSYYLCWSGVPIPMTCAPGLHWSIAGNACVDPDEANCRFSLPFQNVQKSEVPKAIAKRSIKKANVKAKPFSRCPNTGITSIPSPNSCEEYILCVNGMPFDRECAPGLHFSPTLRNCAHPDVAECNLDGCPPTGLHFLPHEDDCNKYYICFNGLQNLMRCPNELHWSTETNRCMEPDEAGCEDGDGIVECPPTGIEQIPYPDDCERFILCINGVEIPLTCAPGLHFSPTQRTCMSPEDAECEDRVWECPEEDTPGVIVFIPNTEDCNMYYLCWQGNQIPLRCPTGLHWSIEGNRCMSPEDAECPFEDDEADKCPEEGIVAIQHPESCEHYILCVNGHEVERECPFGMHFSRTLGNCAHPLVANCILPSRKFDLPTDDSSCPAINSTHELAFMPNKADCGSYYVCLKDESKLFNCAAGFHFDVNRSKCINMNKAQCVI